MQELKSCCLEDIARLTDIEATTEERKRPFVSIVNEIVSQHRAWLDFQEIREGMLREMEVKEKRVLGQCLNDMEMVARIQAASSPDILGQNITEVP